MNEAGFKTYIVSRCRKILIYALNMLLQMNAGVFDTWFSGNKGDIWIEFKWLHKLPKRESTLVKPDMSALQKKWGRERYHEGRRVYVIVGTPEGCCVYMTPDQWENGLSKTEFVLTRKDIIQWIALQVT